MIARMSAEQGYVLILAFALTVFIGLCLLVRDDEIQQEDDE